MNVIIEILVFVIELLVIIGIFAVMIKVVKFAYDKITSNPRILSHEFLNPKNYLPDEEISTLNQLCYLVMIVCFIVNILYSFISWGSDANNLIAFDIVLSLIVAMNIDGEGRKNKLLLLLLVPVGSLNYLLFFNDGIFILEFFHQVVFIYFIKVYFIKFMKYTQTNSLGITIMLLFSIVFISFLITMPVENVSPLNSLVMVSNAFTSNGYAILGKSSLGKLNSIVLVWAGFILSSVGTATLTVAIIKRHLNSRFDDLEKKIKKNKKN